MAVGGTDLDEQDAAVWTSEDGMTWDRVPHDEDVFGGPGAQEMDTITVGGPGLVAVGSDTDNLPDSDEFLNQWHKDLADLARRLQ